MNTKEKIAVMQAFIEGKAVQYKEYASCNWKDYNSNNPRWNWEEFDYRIKPEPKIRPYTFEEMKEAVKKHGSWVKSTQAYRAWIIQYFDEKGVLLSDYAEYSYEELVEDYVWLDDNSPCGVVEE